jgi:hypothetical protein
MSLPKKTTVNIIPGMRYHDAPAAIEWLCRERRRVSSPTLSSATATA